MDARRISSDLHGAIRPPSQRPGVSSHQQQFAAAGPSVSWRQPYAFASDQPTSNSSGRSFRPGGWLSPPIKGLGYQSKIRLMMSAILCSSPATGRRGRWQGELSPCPPCHCYLTTLWASSQSLPSPWPGLPTGYQTIIRLIMAAIRLQVSCNRTNRRATRRIVSLPPWRCCLATLWASFQPPPSPWPGFPIGYQTKIHLIIAAIRLQVSCKWTKRRATWRIVALPPWHYCLTTLCASLRSPPSHWPSLPSDDFMSSGLRALYRSPLRGVPISPGLTMFNSPVHPLSRSLSRDSVRGNRYPRLCPHSQRSWRCLIRLARNGDSKSSPNDTT